MVVTSRADLANLVNEAAIHAAREGRDVLAARDFDEARDRIILGRREGPNVLLPVDERHLYRESYLRDSLAVRLGRRAAELVVFGEGSTGVASDLASATDLATKMVREYGLSPDVGPIGYPAGGPLFLGDGALPAQNRSYSEATQHMIDREVARLLREAEERASTLLDEHRADLDRLTELLLEQETVDGAAVYDVVGRPVPGGSPQVLTASPDGRETVDVD